MTRDEIISMAREAGLQSIEEHWGTVYRAVGPSNLEYFAGLAAARGREAERSRWRAVLDAVVREAPHKHDGPDAPGHSHRIPGVWDQYNGPKSGTTCAWCAAWKTAHELLEEEAIRARAEKETT